MSNPLVIFKNQTLPDSQNFVKLRKEGIKHIERLSKTIWTDYNTHDPGITTLEILCYAITDLGYRANFDIKDILASAPGEANGYDTQFFTAAQILPCEPVTLLDYRKLIIDTTGIKNAWIDITEDYSPAIYLDKTINQFNLMGIGQRIPLRGFYTVRVEFEDDIAELIDDTVRTIKEKDGEIAADKERIRLQKQYAEPAIARLQAHRNLCEDFLEIKTVSYQNITVCADIEVSDDADIEMIEAEICYKVQQYFSPDINFYSLSEMLDKKIPVEEIFEGTLAENGFILNSELEQAGIRHEIRLSDIINTIIGEKDGIAGVVAVKTMLITAEGLGTLDMSKPELDAWILTIPDQLKVPRLMVENPNISHTAIENFSKFTFYRDFLPYMANRNNVWNKLRELQQQKRKYKLRFQTNDLPIPEGNYRNLGAYYPIQNDFPALYGTGLDGFPAEALPNPDAKDPNAYISYQAKIKQFKGYLLFFEQIMANYLAQLSNMKNVFSWDENLTQSTFSQALQVEDFFKSDTLGFSLDNMWAKDVNYEQQLNEITETPQEAAKRRGAALDHILARFAENLVDYALLTKAMFDDKANARLIEDRIQLLKDYPAVSSQRGKAFNYKPLLKDKTTGNWGVDTSHLWNSQNVSGLKRRVSRLLGFKHIEDTNIAPQFLNIKQVVSDYFVELNLPSTSPVWTMRSVHPHASEEYAEGELLYWLSHGSHRQYYEMKHDYDTATQKGQFFFILKKTFTEEDCLEPKNTPYTDDSYCNRIAKSQPFTFVGTEKSQAAKDAETACQHILNQVIAYLKKYANIENFFLVEHLLLRPRVGFKSDEYHFLPVEFCEEEDEKDCNHHLDAYTFRVSIVLPAWSDRFHTIRFRQLVEKTIRMETPAHIYPRICWVNVEQMRDLQEKYQHWIEEMANANTSPGDGGTDGLNLPLFKVQKANDLIDCLTNLKNIYPSAILHDCDEIESDNPQVVLDYTTLGIL